MILPPEAWTAIGVALGGVATAFFAWMGRLGELRSQRQKSKIDYQQSQLALLREEIAVLKTELKAIEHEARRTLEDAYRVQDQARMAMSLAAAHINLLTAHINTRQPPPAPLPPSDLSRYIENLLWSDYVGHSESRAPPHGECK